MAAGGAGGSPAAATPQYHEIEVTRREDLERVFPACYHTSRVAGAGSVFFRAFCMARSGQRRAAVFSAAPAQTASGMQKQKPAAVPSHESWLSLLLPFSSEPALADVYRMFATNRVRNGLLLEHLDALAGDIAIRHAGGGPALEGRVSVVTAVLERTDFHGTISVDRDLVLEGGVTWVGRSSMEVRIRVRSLDEDGTPREHGEAVFVMVARAQAGQEAFAVPGLLADSDETRAALAERTEARARRSRAAAASVWRVPPRASESSALHSLFLTSHVAGGGLPYPPEAHAWMGDTLYHKVDVMHFQNRNTNGQIFGGTLIRSALELAHSAAYAFAGGEPPTLALVDNIQFIAPVPVGSVVRFSSTVAYVRASTGEVVVHVDACLMDPDTAQFHAPTNQFHFTFHTSSPGLRRVMPRTYADGMRYLEARRSLRGCPDE